MNFNDLLHDLSNISGQKILFMGLGNPLRSDDVSGLRITEYLQRSQVYTESHFILAYTTPENHLQEILDFQPDCVIIIDTADWGGPAGDISWIKSDCIDELAISTHSYSLSLIEKYLRLNGINNVKYVVIQPASKNLNKEIGIQKTYLDD